MGDVKRWERGRDGSLWVSCGEITNGPHGDATQYARAVWGERSRSDAFDIMEQEVYRLRALAEEIILDHAREVDAYRETIAQLQRRIAELEADKV